MISFVERHHVKKCNGDIIGGDRIPRTASGIDGQYAGHGITRLRAVHLSRSNEISIKEDNNGGADVRN